MRHHLQRTVTLGFLLLSLLPTAMATHPRLPLAVSPVHSSGGSLAPDLRKGNFELPGWLHLTYSHSCGLRGLRQKLLCDRSRRHRRGTQGHSCLPLLTLTAQLRSMLFPWLPHQGLDQGNPSPNSDPNMSCRGCVSKLNPGPSLSRPSCPGSPSGPIPSSLGAGAMLGVF